MKIFLQHQERYGLYNSRSACCWHYLTLYRMYGSRSELYTETLKPLICDTGGTKWPFLPKIKTISQSCIINPKVFIAEFHDINTELSSHILYSTLLLRSIHLQYFVMSTIIKDSTTPSPSQSSLAHPFAIAFIIVIVLAPLFDLWQRYNKKSAIISSNNKNVRRSKTEKKKKS